MSTTTVWESGLTCDSATCGQEFVLGEEIMYWYGEKLHPRCANLAAAERREAAGQGDDVLAVAHRILAAKGRVILTRRQLRDLIALASTSPDFDPVRKPDAGTGRRQWYGRMPGWATERVTAGLSAPEVAGLWLDFIEIGRMPPLRQCDLSVLVGAVTVA